MFEMFARLVRDKQVDKPAWLMQKLATLYNSASGAQSPSLVNFVDGLAGFESSMSPQDIRSGMMMAACFDPRSIGVLLDEAFLLLASMDVSLHSFRKTGLVWGIFAVLNMRDEHRTEDGYKEPLGDWSLEERLIELLVSPHDLYTSPMPSGADKLNKAYGGLSNDIKSYASYRLIPARVGMMAQMLQKLQVRMLDTIPDTDIHFVDGVPELSWRIIKDIEFAVLSTYSARTLLLDIKWSVV